MTATRKAKNYVFITIFIYASVAGYTLIYYLSTITIYLMFD